MIQEQTGNGRIIDWESRWSNEAKRKRMSTLQGIVSKYSGIPGVIGMHGGLPPSETFPFDGMHFSFHAAGSDSAAVDATDGLAITDPQLVAAAQQYNMFAKGYPPLQSWALEFVCSCQQPATQHNGIGIDLAVTPGSSASLDALARVLLNPGDPLLLEEFTYSHHVESHLLPMDCCDLVPVALDGEGLVPSDLDRLMNARQAAGLALPRVLYTIPTGQNPTGSVMSRQRMEQVYALAQKWDLVLIEDDAYFWLQYPDGPDNVPGLNIRPGFLSLDTDGRVIRLDTLAKLLGPGYRLGWLAGPPELVHKVSLYIAAISVGAASVCQVTVHQLFRHWGRSGFETFVSRLQQTYAQKAQVAEAAAAEHLSGLAEWQPVRAGMFMWCKLSGGGDAAQLMPFAAAEKVMVVPGHVTSVVHLLESERRLRQQEQQQQVAAGSSEGGCQQIPPCPYFRVSFASVGGSDADVWEGFARLKRAIINFQQQQQQQQQLAVAAAH